MKNSVTALFDLNWNDKHNIPFSIERAIPKEVAKVAYDGIMAVAKVCDPNYPIYDGNKRHFFVLEIPAQEKILCDLIGWCKLGGYPYTIRWFFNELTRENAS